MQLHIEEQIQITDLINQYRTVHQEMVDIENLVKELTAKQDELALKLDSIRQSEKQLGLNLSEKYGSGKLNPVTLEYTLD
jgi:hypothetical protein